ncbi:hypothetical protein HRG84_03050 [Flavisolibacter sp. BT320]|nr:hypothetical protein [Flavisolibacter longurius]
MKFLILILLGLTPLLSLRAQSTPYELVASKIAQKMKDSLVLSDVQFQAVYNVNLDIYHKKSALRKQFENTDSLSIQIQRVEQQRDSLYRPILSASQYNIYKQKKRWLVSAN